MIDLSSEQKIRAYINFCTKKENNNYFNALEMLNMSEPSMSQLLAWLLNVKGQSENSIQYRFCKAFFEVVKLKEKKNENDIYKVINKINENELVNIIKNMQVTVEKKFDNDNVRIDLYLESKDLNSKKFECVIENKKRANLSCSKDDEKYITQVEKYHNLVGYSDDKNIRKYIYLCAEEIEDVNEAKIKDKLPKSKRNKIYIDSKYKNVKDLLNAYNYTVIEHSEIAKILHSLLQNDENCKGKFDNNGILKPVKYESMLKLAENLCKYMNDCKSKNLLEKIFSQKEIMSELKKCCQDCENRNIFFRYDRHIIPILEGYKKLFIEIFKKPRIYGSTVINFREYLTEQNYAEILCLYIEYLEQHRGLNPASDNLKGYSKIIGKEFIYDICKDIHDKNKEEWEKIRTTEIRSEAFKLIIDNIK